MSSKKAQPKSGREAALLALVRVEQDNAYLNLAMPAYLSGLPADERALAVRLAAGTTQHLNTLDWALNLFLNRSLNTLTPWMRNILRLGAYQLIYLHRVPDYAVVSESVRLARRYGHRGVAGLTNALLRRLAGEASSLPWPDRRNDPSFYLSVKYSQPRWLAARMTERFGFQEAEKWCLACAEKPPVSIRPNLLKIQPLQLINKLKNEGIETLHSPVVPGMLRIKSGGSPAFTPSFTEGLFTIQGESSSLVAPLISARPGDTVVDLCSAPGGKATHLAELIKDEGQVYAVELRKNRLQLVKKSALRLGLKAVKPLCADGRKIESYNLPVPSAVLVDAPCSGLGVTWRLPEIKWRRTSKDLLPMQSLQLDLLRAAARVVPRGGKLLYSVCTTEPEETDQVVKTFSGEHKDFILQELPPFLPLSLRSSQGQKNTITLWPHRHKLDGFFIALWRKNS